MEINRIGWIRTDFPGKFGIPRQSGLVEDLAGTVVLRQSIGMRTLSGDWKSFRIYGLFGSFLNRQEINGSLW